MTFKEFSEMHPNKGLNDYYIFLNKVKSDDKSITEDFQNNLDSKLDYNGGTNYSSSVSEKNIKGNTKGPVVFVLLVSILIVSIYTGFYALNIITGIILIYGLLTTCPNCGGWFVRRRLSSDEINREIGFKDVKRVDKIKDMSGRQIAQKERYEQIQTTRVTYLNTFCCNNCNYKWQSKSVSER